MKKRITIAISAVLTLSLTACEQPAIQPVSQDSPSDSHVEIPNYVEIPNPFTTHDTLAEAEVSVGFSLSAPDNLEEGDTRTIMTIQDGMLEVVYKNADDETTTIRKAAGTDDISGDYNTYPEETTTSVNGHTVTMKGKDGKVHTAIWTDEAYTYAITSDTGIEPDDAAELAEIVSANESTEPVLVGGDPATWGPPLEETTQIPNPYVSYVTLEDACAAAGFALSIPESMNGYGDPVFQVMNGSMLQVIYRNAEEETVTIRKEPGSEDISGDYRVYEQSEEISLGERTAILKGNNDMVSLALWTEDGYTYSVSASSGFTSSDMTDLIAEIQ